MEFKTCKYCGITKELVEGFYKGNKSKCKDCINQERRKLPDFIQRSCVCCSEFFFVYGNKKLKKYCSDKCKSKYKSRIFREKNPDYHKDWNNANPEKIKIRKVQTKIWRKNNIERIREKERNPKRITYIKKWRKDNPENVKGYSKKHNNSNKRKEWVENNKEKIRESVKKANRKYSKTDKRKEWLEKNKDNIREWKRKYNNLKRETDVEYKIKANLRRRLLHVLNGVLKHDNTMNLVGCSANKLKNHLESQFTFGMNWKNYGYGWHIDHIIPCASFDLTKEEQQRKCFHYTNLQPLWALENIKKSDKIE